MNTFSLSSWILQSITLFLAILASIPLLKAIIGLSLVAISETFKLKSPTLRSAGVKLMPAFLRASLGLGIAIGFTSPASAETPLPPIPVIEIPVIDRVIDFKTQSEPVADLGSEVETTVALEDERKNNKKVEVVKNPSPNNPYVIKSGDSLWSIAQNQVVGEAASVTEIDSAWRKIWRANRDVIGNNPSLIRPGQEINLDVFSN